MVGPGLLVFYNTIIMPIPQAFSHYTGEKCPVHHVCHIRHVHHVPHNWFLDDYRRTVRGIALILYKLMEACKPCLGMVMVDLGLFVKVTEIILFSTSILRSLSNMLY